MTTLIEEQVRNTHFIIPDLGIIIAFGEDYFRLFQERREMVRKRGGSIEAIGWPDGTTIFLERIDLRIPFDPEYLVDHYHAVKRQLIEEMKNDAS